MVLQARIAAFLTGISVYRNLERVLRWVYTRRDLPVCVAMWDKRAFEGGAVGDWPSPFVHHQRILGYWAPQGPLDCVWVSTWGGSPLSPPMEMGKVSSALGSGGGEDTPSQRPPSNSTPAWARRGGRHGPAGHHHHHLRSKTAWSVKCLPQPVNRFFTHLCHLGPSAPGFAFLLLLLLGLDR